mgnify:CR=1 FL=1
MGNEIPCNKFDCSYRFEARLIMYIVYAYSFLCVQDIVVMPPFQFIDINVSFCRVDNKGCV